MVNLVPVLSGGEAVATTLLVAADTQFTWDTSKAVPTCWLPVDPLNFTGVVFTGPASTGPPGRCRRPELGLVDGGRAMTVGADTAGQVSTASGDELSTLELARVAARLSCQ